MKKILVILLVVLCVFTFSAQAGDVTLKTSGPSGQGEVIWWCPVTGITNTTFTSNGISYMTIKSDAVVKIGVNTAWTGVITNNGVGSTNVIYIGNGSVTNVVRTP